MVEVLKEKFADLNLTYSIGGQISFDVFPKVHWVVGGSTCVGQSSSRSRSSLWLRQQQEAAASYIS